MMKKLMALILLSATECGLAMTPMIKNQKVIASVMKRLITTEQNMQQIVIGGIYKHYKGGLYKVNSLDRKTEGVYENPHADSEESSQLRVSYKALNSPTVFSWTREYEEFAGTVEVDGKQINRFERVVDNEKKSTKL